MTKSLYIRGDNRIELLSSTSLYVKLPGDNQQGGGYYRRLDLDPQAEEDLRRWITERGAARD